MYVYAVSNIRPNNFQINKNNSINTLRTNRPVISNCTGYTYPVSGISFQANLSKIPTKLERFEGCILGGAIGDAMGYPIESLNIKDIYKKFGNVGLHYPLKRNGVYHISDDTQMSLFTIKGLLNSLKYNNNLGEEPNYKIIYSAYQDWYKTQISRPDVFVDTDLFGRQELYSRRGPGTTCLSSLKDNIMGSIDSAVNDSPTNGAVMKTAPIGLIYSSSPELAFKIGMKVGAMTHGNEGAYLPAGYLSSLIAHIQQGKTLEESFELSTKILKGMPKHRHFLSLLKKAKKLSKTDMPEIEAIKMIGSGYRGDEAVAISMYSALKHSNSYKKAVITSINHSGDSDTTGAITGNIMGAFLGSNAIPRNWKDNIELSDLLYKCSSDLIKAKESCENYTDMIKRRKADVFIGKITKMNYTDEDLIKIKSMSKEQRAQYIWSLKQKINK